MDTTLTFGQWLKNRRQALDLTQAQLAEAASCAPGTVRSIEAGRRRPSQQVAELLAVALYVSPDERQAFLLWARGLGGAVPRAIGEPSVPLGPPASLYLPVPPTSLIGREHEITLVRAALWRASTRLVTLTGPPGIGKTRLALAVAERVEQDFENGVCFVSLAPITDPDLVAGTIARSLDVHIGPTRSAAEAVMQHLRGKQLLLLLDNFEQVVGSATLVADLLASAPRLKVLVTSRIALHLRGEREIIVPPLALPTPGDKATPASIEHVEAAALFVERAQDAQSSFALTERNARTIADICVRLDGLPLAIELAAAKVKVLSLGDLLSGLDDSLNLLTGGARDLPDRHRTLRNAIQSSYGLLSSRRQRIFRWLGVFVSPFTLEAAERVAGASLDDIAALVDASMVHRQEVASDVGSESRETRYDMLAMLREFAVQELEARGELDAAGRRHADYFLELMRSAEAHLLGEGQSDWLARLGDEQPNLRAALSWALAHGEVDAAAQAASAVWRFWSFRGFLSEGRRQLEEILSRGTALSGPVRARVLNAVGNLSRSQLDYSAAEKYLAESLELYRSLDDQLGMHGALNNLGLVAFSRGDYPLAQARLLECLALNRQIGDSALISFPLSNLGLVSWAKGDYLQARGYLNEALQLKRASEGTHGVAINLNNLGAVLASLGLYKEADAAAAEGLDLFKSLGSQWGISLWMLRRAAALAAAGEWERAAQLWGAARAQLARIGTDMEEVDQSQYARARAKAAAQGVESAWKLAEAAGLQQPLDTALEFALKPIAYPSSATSSSEMAEPSDPPLTP